MLSTADLLNLAHADFQNLTLFRLCNDKFWMCQEDGFLAKILVEAGTKDVAVGTPLAVVVGTALWILS